MLKQRLLTAGVLLPLVVWGVLSLPSFEFSIAIMIIVLLGAWEWAALCGMSSRPARLAYCAVIILSIAALILFDADLGVTQATASTAVLWWVSATLWLVRIELAGSPIHVISSATLRQRLFGGGIGMLVLIPAWFALVALHQSIVYGPRYVLFLLVLVWVADSGAYFAGHRWGRNKLAPHISPGKTWEGVAGAMVLSTLAAFAAAALLEFKSVIAFLIVCMVTVGFSVVGDLLESLFKRRAGVKDSGTLVPGHGGVLDRIDSITAAAPVFLLGLMISERWQ